MFGAVAEDDHVAMLFMLLEGIPDAFFLTQAVDKSEVAFEILGHILADGVTAALLETVVDTGEAVMLEDGGNFGRYGFLRTDFKCCALVEVGRQRQGGIGGGGGEGFDGEGGGESGEGEVVGLVGGHGVEFKDDNEVCMVT